MNNDFMKVLAIVVTYNGEDWVDYCFSSLVDSHYPVDIICIDNDSSDQTADLLKQRFPSVELIQSGSNLGFGKANNIGLKKCLENHYDFAFLLNQDARIEPDSIEKLIAVQQKHPEYGVLSPVHRSKDNRFLDEKFADYLANHNTRDFISDCLLKNPLKDVYQTHFVNAAIWLISKDCLEKTGIFDPEFPHYGEDVEFLYRLNQYGFKVGIVPAALGNHARYKITRIRKHEDFSAVSNQEYVKLLNAYKRFPAGKLGKYSYFFRKMMVELFRDIIMLDWANFKKDAFVYSKLLINKLK